ncbi:MAG TPA: acetoacetate--CoA ligase [Gemmatimonadales bacterium]|nr:acetoacetate--CoA ligase [Gemmatimonadales bacterium]
MPDAPICWMPDPGRREASLLAHFLAAERANGAAVPTVHESDAFRAAHAWSIREPAAFWAAVWQDGDVIADRRADGTMWDAVLVGGDRMAPPDAVRGPRWFTGARLNFAENLLRGPDDALAIVAWDERGAQGEWSRARLRRDVARVAAAFRTMGVVPGDRVAGWLPNIPETIVAMLAAASLGAVWTSCSPDFGVEGIVDRFGQTEPTVLLFCDGYRYAGKAIDCTARAAELLPRLPSVRHAVMIPFLDPAARPSLPGVVAWADIGDPAATVPEYRRLPFDHPLYILYSSGTTGLPKCLVHGAGGTLLQHLKEHRLHGDLRAGERLFYFTTCGWMMWNWLVSGLAAGATIVCYDGAPMPPAEPDLLWRLAAEARVDVFGTSAKYLALAEKEGMRPAERHDLSRVRAVLSTGSPLAPESFDWVGTAVGPHVQVASISGGTDIVSCFVLGNPLEPVRRGEIQGPGLGMAVEVFDAEGRQVPDGEAGELVCTRPFPSMPVAFWRDPEGQRYREAYFETYPGVWRHGDWSVRTPSGGFRITGRSDATLNPGGVRIGTAEIYRQVEAIDAIVESLVIGQRIPGAADGDVRVVLFVRLRDGVVLDEALRDRIRRRIREGASPHHVPKVILDVPDIPRTRSGKLSELAVRDVVEGRPVANVGALANPEALVAFRGRPELG